MGVTEWTNQGFVTRPRRVSFCSRREEHRNGSCSIHDLKQMDDGDGMQWCDTAAESLATFARALGRPTTLRYTRINAIRRTIDAIGNICERRLDVFAVTGRLILTDGRFVPIGLSGKGDGLMQLNVSRASAIAQIMHGTEAAVPTPNAVMSAVLDHQPAAVLAHEAIGHFAEGSCDLLNNLNHRLGCRLAPEWLTARDNPRDDGAASYDFDDEGVNSSEPTTILLNGQLVAQLHSCASAAHAYTLSTANARSSQTTFPPIPRMSNLTIGGGEAELESIIERMGNGLFVRHLSHGFSRGTYVEARIVLAEYVRRGRLTGRFVSGGRVVESADLFVRAQEATSIARLNPNALCGKRGQILYDVGTIAPAIRLSSLRVVS